MRRLAWIVIVLFLVACGREAPPDVAAAPAPVPATPSAPAAPAEDAWFRLPGDYAESTSLADLRARFGDANVLVDESPQDDGSVRRRAVLFPDDPARRAYAEFHDAEAMAGLASLSVRDPESIWRGKGDVRVGTSFAGLVQANRGPFYFSGFDAEGRGWVRDQWSPARDDAPELGALDVGEGEHMYFGVDLGLRDPAAAGVPRDEYSAASDDPRWPALGESAVVTAIVASTSLDDEWE